jgi:hypothetical protein
MKPSLANFPATACSLCGIPFPAYANPEPYAEVNGHANEVLGGPVIRRMLVYAPDAIGMHLYRRYPDDFSQVNRLAPIVTKLSSMVPPKTPVCFASMFTGAMPEQHGIRRYERPALACDTLFDALIRSGRRVAIVAVENSSIDLIFRGRELDYFSESYDEHVTAAALELIARNEHDFILAYHQEYDDWLHETEPFSTQCLAAFRRHLGSFVRLVQAAEESWTDSHWAACFTPDHGAHLNAATGRGDHGEDIPEDMELIHFWRVS